jgi:hypothetical protein
MKLNEISSIRLYNQKLAGTEYKTAKEIVSWMGAMQAQDFSMAEWAVGIRILDPTLEKIEAAFNSGEIIRTHIMRPTWHFISADDIYWMLALTVPKIKASMKGRHKQLELSEAVLSKTNRILDKILSENTNLTREEIVKVFHKAGIKTDNNRLSHILVWAELDGIICSGPLSGRKQTYALLSQRVPHGKKILKDEALAELARRYFTSHGPATLKDFYWWSGLSAADAAKGLGFVKSGFSSETVGSEIYWLTNSFSHTKSGKTSAIFLPAYDEFLISYKDRSASLALSDHKITISSNGIFRPVILVNGQVEGVWKTKLVKNNIIIETEIFKPPDKLTRILLENEVYKYGKFLNKETRLNL